MTDNEREEIAVEPVARRPWIRSLLLCIVILICGMIIGGVTTAIFFHAAADHGHRGDHLPQSIAERMQKKYNLSDDQRQRLQVIFDEHIKKLSAIRTEIQPRMDAEQEALRQSVEPVLTPDQAKRWREEYETMRKQWHQRDGGGGPPPPPPGPPPQ